MDFGMKTALGNEVVTAIVKTSKAENLTLTQTDVLLRNISKIIGFEDAYTQPVAERVYRVLGYIVSN